MTRASLYIDPPSRHFLGDRLFEPTGGKFHSSLARCFVRLRDHLSTRGIPVHTVDRLPSVATPEVKVCVSFGLLREYRRLARRPDVRRSALFITESPIVEPLLYRRVGRARPYFKRLYSCSDDPALAQFLGIPFDGFTFRWPMDRRCVDEALWQCGGRGFLIMLNMNKLPRIYWNELFTERMRAVEFFARRGEIDLYGVGWDRPSARVGTSWVPWTARRLHDRLRTVWERVRPDPLVVSARTVYKGELDAKLPALASYRFALCFENTLLKGWLTEKIFECFYVGTVPIYWGATDIEQLVPPDCYIDMRHFADYEDLRAFLHSLTDRQVQCYRDRAREFLASSAFAPFSLETFIGLFERLLEEDAGINAPPPAACTHSPAVAGEAAL